MALFATCNCNVNAPDIASDLVRVLEHNGIEVTLTAKETCCGMPRYEHGNLERSTGDKTSSVHFARFEFTPEMIWARRPRLIFGKGLRSPRTHPENQSIPAGLCHNVGHEQGFSPGRRSA